MWLKVQFQLSNACMKALLSILQVSHFRVQGYMYTIVVYYERLVHFVQYLFLASLSLSQLIGATNIPSSVHLLHRFSRVNDKKTYVSQQFCPKCCTEVYSNICSACNVEMVARNHPISVSRLDVAQQLKCIVERNLQSLIKYGQDLFQRVSHDVLSAAFFHQEAPSTNVNLHLMINVDGGSFFSTTSSSVWPLQAVVLNLPPVIRQSAENAVLIALYMSKKKPNWNILFEGLKDILSAVNFCVTEPASHIVFTFHTKIVLCVCDLPAIASVSNTMQYNGKFGCIKCTHPGETLQQGGGHSRVYPSFPFSLKDNALYKRCIDAVQRGSAPVFGIKGPSVLSEHILIPEQILTDPMHMLYEGIGKMLLSSFFDSKNHHEVFYMGRPRAVNDFSSRLLSVKLLPGMPPFRSISDLSFWKASEVKNFFLFALPLLQRTLPPSYFKHALAFALICHICNESTISIDQLKDIDSFVSFFCNETLKLYGKQYCTMNVHLLCHLSSQIHMFGPIWAYSMFSFESRIKDLKGMFKGTRGVLEQIANSFLLRSNLSKDISLMGQAEKELINSLSKPKRERFYKATEKIEWSFVQFGGEFASIKRVVDNESVEVQKYTYQPILTEPIATEHSSLAWSRLLSLYRHFVFVSPSPVVSVIPKSAIKSRCIVVACSNVGYTLSTIPTSFEHS
jgi:hypothetical protein